TDPPELGSWCRHTVHVVFYNISSLLGLLYLSSPFLYTQLQPSAFCPPMGPSRSFLSSLLLLSPVLLGIPYFALIQHSGMTTGRRNTSNLTLTNRLLFI